MKPNGGRCGGGLQTQQGAVVWRHHHKLLMSLVANAKAEGRPASSRAQAYLGLLPETTLRLCVSQRVQLYYSQLTTCTRHDLNSVYLDPCVWALGCLQELPGCL